MDPELRRLHENPTPLKVVAWICIAFGVWSVAKMAFGIAQGGCILDLGVLGFAAAYGLRRHQNGWRIATLLFSGLGLFLNALALLFMLLGLSNLDPNYEEPPLTQPAVSQLPSGVRSDSSSPVRPPPGVIGHSERVPRKVELIRIQTTRLGAHSLVLAWVLILVGGCLCAYMMYVLLRPDIRDLFKVSRMNDRPVDDFPTTPS